MRIIKSLMMALVIPAIISTSQISGFSLQQFDYQDIDSIRHFEGLLDNLRTNLEIPAISAAVIKDKKVIWANGFGYADLEKRIKATDSTAYRVASVTKTYASTIIMQLVNEGKIDLEAPVSDYGVELKGNIPVKVKHILSHTAQYQPGEIFRYSGARFGYLEDVIKYTTGKSFGELFIERIIIPLDLKYTAPSIWTDTLFYPEITNQFTHTYQKLAKPYSHNRDYLITESEYIMGFMVAGGLVTTVYDMAIYNIALDTNFFFDELTRNMIYSPTKSTKGKSLPYGLGWFVQDYGELSLLWHYGWHPDAASSLIVKVPEKNISFMIFANTDMLSKPFSLHNGNVLNSPAALIFLKTFLPEEFRNKGIDKKENELEEIIFKSTGKKPLINVFQLVVLYFCQVLFVSAIIFWPSRFIAIKLFPTKLRSKKNEGFKGFLFRTYLALVCLICFFFTGVLFYYPPIIYWHELPGWFDGIPLYQNLSLAIPSILTILALVLIPIISYIWIRKTWTLIHRIYFSLIVFTTGIYLLLLHDWHLIGIGYYWKYFIYNL